MASFISLLLFSLLSLSFSNAATTLPPNMTLHHTIRKDPRTLQYYTEITLGNTFFNVVIDLGGQITWFNCDKYNSPTYRAVACDTNRCKTLKGSGCMGCNGAPRPGCTNNTCGSSVYNPYRNLLYAEGFGTDKLTVLSTDGQFVLRSYDTRGYAFSCADSALLRNLARQTIGMIGLAKAKSSLPKQLSQAFNLPYKFALCLPSSSENGFGDIFIGGGPYIMRPAIQDLAKLLTTTPLVINPVSTAPIYTEGDPSDEYFIGVTSIRIDGKSVSLNNSLLSIDRNGNGGTKLSTIDRYTVLHDSIYRAFARAYVSTAAGKNIRRVGPVKPFGVCFSRTGANGGVPYVDLVLQRESVKWRFSGANLMVNVNSSVMCLGIMNGGSNPRTAVVLGGLQLENYVLEFDLVSSNLGFSNSLLQMNTSCSHSRIF